MAKLGTKQKPAVVRVKNEERAYEIVSICNARGWEVIAGVEPDLPEDVSDVEKLLKRKKKKRLKKKRE